LKLIVEWSSELKIGNLAPIVTGKGDMGVEGMSRDLGVLLKRIGL